MASNKVFVSIPCYRDAEVVPTVRSIINATDHPEHLHFGILLQLDLGKEADQII